MDVPIPNIAVGKIENRLEAHRIYSEFQSVLQLRRKKARKRKVKSNGNRIQDTLRIYVYVASSREKKEELCVYEKKARGLSSFIQIGCIKFTIYWE